MCKYHHCILHLTIFDGMKNGDADGTCKRNLIVTGSCQLKRPISLPNTIIRICAGSKIVKGWVQPGTSAVQRGRAPGDLRRTVPAPATANTDAPAGTCNIPRTNLLDFKDRVDLVSTACDGFLRFTSECNTCLPHTF